MLVNCSYRGSYRPHRLSVRPLGAVEGVSQWDSGRDIDCDLTGGQEVDSHFPFGSVTTGDLVDTAEGSENIPVELVSDVLTGCFGVVG
jgi:hypothetical protein